MIGMSENIETLLYICSGVTVMASILMIENWLRTKDERSLLFWSAHFLLVGISLLLIRFRGEIHDALSIHLSNTFLILAFGFAWLGAKAFNREKLRWWYVCIGPMLWACLWLVPSLFSMEGLRVIVVNILISSYALLTACSLGQGYKDHLPSRLPLVGVFVTMALLYLYRVITVFDGPVENALVFNHAFVAFLIFTNILAVVANTVFMRSLTVERRELEQRIFASTDALTGCLSRRYFLENSSQIIQSYGKTNAKIGVIILDLDHFKRINDQFGHAAGDHTLQRFADIVRSHLRSTDLCGRIGGEEFAIFLQDVEEDEISAIAERIRRQLSAEEIIFNGEKISPTVSIGFAIALAKKASIDHMLHCADIALYAAKSAGRNTAAQAQFCDDLFDVNVVLCTAS